MIINLPCLSQAEIVIRPNTGSKEPYKDFIKLDGSTHGHRRQRWQLQLYKPEIMCHLNCGTIGSTAKHMYVDQKSLNSKLIILSSHFVKWFSKKMIVLLGFPLHPQNIFRYF